ncbi:MAG: DUF2892 domain-containing protein [Acidimicrobiia bacterium]|nr:MAG: DUF2892 domain-containing protein [Acidimicrobiia bacterium]
MKFMNEASWDRIARVILGAVLIVVGFGGAVDGTVGTVLGIVGLIPLVTGLAGWCPIYAILNLRTREETHSAA